MLEKALSKNSVEAYLRDVKKLSSFCRKNKEITDSTKVSITILRELYYLHECKSSSKSQARILSGIKSFYHYLNLENVMNPCDKIDRPRIERKLPDTLSPDEINDIISLLFIKPSWRKK